MTGAHAGGSRVTGSGRPTGVAERVRRAAALHARGMAANDQMRPTAGARQLRAALELLDGIEQPDGTYETGRGKTETTVDLVAARNLCGRIRVSLAFAEAERGDVELGLRLLADGPPSPVLPVLAYAFAAGAAALPLVLLGLAWS